MNYIAELRKKIGHDEIIAVGAGIIIYKDRKVLLQKRKDNLCWAIHGGAVEIGETVEDAAKRELFEETGLIANEIHLLGVFSGNDFRHTYPNGDKVYVVGITYVCNDFTGDMVSETNETLELKWFDIDDLPKKLNRLDIKALHAFVELMNCTK